VPYVIDTSTILVVDDSPTNLMLLGGILSAEGYQVTPANNGETALAAVAAHPPDLILLDIRMAGLDGFEVCRRLKARAASRDIPIIFISAASETAERVEGLELGAVDFISKPIQKEELKARVRTHLELRRLRVQSEHHAADLEAANRCLEGELAERKRAEEAVATTLREKEALLREAHHRVKNNLALIVSLMRLEGGRSRAPETKAVLLEMQARIQSVVLLNEVLYKTESYTMVRLADYLRQIATYLFQAQNARPGAVRLTLDLGNVDVLTNQAIPCGLIVNELVTNSLKHAFAGERSGEISVGLREEADGRVRLWVSDTGAGLPPGMAAKRGDSLGLQLVSDLARQLRGVLDIGPGSTFTVTFPPRLQAYTVEIPPVAK
jgi:two-component sensor histidine kinase/ActR/RegA family two-component response regulator